MFKSLMERVEDLEAKAVAKVEAVADEVFHVTEAEYKEMQGRVSTLEGAIASRLTALETAVFFPGGLTSRKSIELPASSPTATPSAGV